MLTINVVGARPNFMKMAPVVLEMKRRGLEQVLVHTGQHYDPNMDSVFFEELGMPVPDIHLHVGSNTHARQTAQVMTAFDEVCEQYRPARIVVGGDVNSTLAVALVAAKRGICLAHVESGLRSFDRSMPEEINRIVTDSVADILLTTEHSANENLLREGIPAERIFFVGNSMIDSLTRHVASAVSRAPWSEFGLAPRQYALLTLHRPSNVDDPENLERLMRSINEVADSLPVLFPVHPRTRAVLSRTSFLPSPRLHMCGPLSYISFLGLMAKAALLVTDSGGIQEETTALGVPCLTLRKNTERPSTVTTGTNRLIGDDARELHSSVRVILDGNWPTGQRPPLWDGNAAHRIVDALEAWAGASSRDSLAAMAQ